MMPGKLTKDQYWLSNPHPSQLTLHSLNFGHCLYDVFVINSIILVFIDICVSLQLLHMKLSLC